MLTCQTACSTSGSIGDLRQHHRIKIHEPHCIQLWNGCAMYVHCACNSMHGRALLCTDWAVNTVPDSLVVAQDGSQRWCADYRSMRFGMGTLKPCSRQLVLECLLLGYAQLFNICTEININKQAYQDANFHLQSKDYCSSASMCKYTYHAYNCVIRIYVLC